MPHCQQANHEEGRALFITSSSIYDSEFCLIHYKIEKKVRCQVRLAKFLVKCFPCFSGKTWCFFHKKPTQAVELFSNFFEAGKGGMEVETG